jgi:ribosomal protein L7/L12
MSKFQIRIISIGSNETPLLKTIRLVADLGALDAASVFSYLQDRAPCVLVAGVNSEVAEHAANLLRSAGAEVVVEASSLEVPTVLRPQTDRRYRWHWFRGAIPV